MTTWDQGHLELPRTLSGLWPPDTELKRKPHLSHSVKICWRAWSAPPSSWGPGRRRVAHVPWPRQRLRLPHLLSFTPTSSAGAGSWDEINLGSGPCFLLCPHIQANRTHVESSNSEPLCSRNGVQGGQGYFNLPSPPKEGMWFFTEGNLKWTKVFSL